MKKIILKIEGMSCSACANHVEKYLNKQPGIIDASVNLVLGQALIHYEDNIDINILGQYINDSGYKYAGLYDENDKKKDHNKYYLIILSILIVFIMYISMAHMFNLPLFTFLDIKQYPLNYAICLFFLSVIYLIYGKDIIINGIKNLIHKAPNMDTLVATSVIVSFLYSFINMIQVIFGHYNLVYNLYFESVCMIILLVKLGRYIDKNSKEKTKEAIKDLVQVTPEFALLKTKDKTKKITIDEVKVGDILLVKPGMKVAVDGKITAGSAHFDESFITGESNPVKKSKGEEIMAGSINYDGLIEYKALKIGPKSTISEMVHLVLEASNSKMPISRIVDKISYYFVPIIIIIAFITFFSDLILGKFLNEAIIHLTSVLVVACPCALGLATPLAIIVSIGSAAKEGLLIKTSETLEIASHIDTVIFDKTGTLTYGELKISKIYNYSKYSNEKLLNIVSNIESNSDHPIAKVLNSYKSKTLKVSAYKELTGKGIQAKINNKTYYIGNRKILNKVTNNYLQEEENLANQGNSIIYIVEDEEIIGLIGVKDTIRKEAKKTVKKLQELGYKVIMLTGDNEITASRIGQELEINNIIANVMPSEKTKYIKKLQEDNMKILMLGDGINDAPSLATSNIGISFKNSTDIATNSADVIITNDKIDNVLTFLLMGKNTLKNIKQNLFWAFFYNILMIPIAAGIFESYGLKINPMLASGAMMLSSLCVVFNALRLKNIKIT